MNITLMFPGENVYEMKELELEQNIVIVGPNGSGKTRLGVKIEETMPGEKVQRISAQRQLNVPEFAPLKFLEQAQNELFFGTENFQGRSNKIGFKWGGIPATAILSDFDRVLSTLFAKHNARNEAYVKESTERKMRGEKEMGDIPFSPIDQLIYIWDLIYPQRKVTLSEGRVQVTTPGIESPSYHGKEMSDGERVVLYLIGQCLCAVPGTILILDEPEIHLHRSVMTKLWDTLEEVRKDCRFIYITHDLDFASSRIGSKKFWIKEFDGVWWKIQEVPEVIGLPEELVMNIIGSRKKVLFVEGERGSFDTAIYQVQYPDYFVVPRGSCEKVIESTRALRNSPELHMFDCYGIIDRDYKTDEELDNLETYGVYSLEVAEVENLLIVEEVIELMSNLDELPKEEVVPKAKINILKRLQGELENQISLRSAKEISFRLNTYNTKAKGLAQLKEAAMQLIESVKIDDIYSQNDSLFTAILQEADYKKALKYYNRKSLVQEVATVLHLRKEGYEERFLRRIRGQYKEQFQKALGNYLPKFPL
ncbi:DUF4435 domain-containing protein [Paenibacillus sp. MMS20-IR301]|uniref:DUF4435 domain-containing protein n=1 Tax=Paenibacillus sp. MMS20-IR301 TaxID=2895946 RepID=UPI0028E26236|nr:AAA family ATPase [Paenibacillus sp. MMS20-IR301]WNS46348.1 AAA family ATPase [Paenibacillus sp. MMS20-IR301]